jgi:hypothetical protein
MYQRAKILTSLFLPLLFNVVWNVLAREITKKKRKKEMKSIHLRKEM